MSPIVVILLAINTGVFILWQMLGDSPFMVENFLVSWDGLRAGHWWTLLTSEFSHVWPVHFFVNMLVLYSFGPIVEMTIGSRRFVTFYLLAAIIASLSHALVSGFLLNKPDLPALGASGAISGVIMLFALMYPRAQLLFFFIIPVPALVGVLFAVGLDAVGLIAQTEGGGLPIGHGAHLGGAATGALYYFLIVHRLRVRHADPLQIADAKRFRQWLKQHGEGRNSGGGAE